MKNVSLLITFVFLFTGCLNSSDSGPDNADDIAFLEDYAQEEGVIQTESGLLYKILETADGEGVRPDAESIVLVHYHGTLVSGTIFDSSVERGEPAEFLVDGVIDGFAEGLMLMSVGDKYELVIPSSLAYGNISPGFPIHAGATLIFEVELLEIIQEEEENEEEENGEEDT